MREAKIIFREARCSGREIDERSVGIADQSIEASVLHHDDEDMVEAPVIVLILAIGMCRKTERRSGNDESGNYCAQNSQASSVSNCSKAMSHVQMILQ